MHGSRWFPLWLAALALAPFLTGDGLAAQTIRSVSNGELELVPGAREVTLRIDGAGLGGVTGVRFMKNGREVEGIRSTLRASDRSVVLAIVAEPMLDPLDGVEIELVGPRIRRPIRVPAKLLVASDSKASLPAGAARRGADRNTPSDRSSRRGSPASNPPASDASVQIASIETDAERVYVGGTVQGRVRLTTAASEPVEVEIVSERPNSLEAPGVVLVPAGQLEATFDLEGVSEYVYYGDPWVVEVQARKVPFASGPTVNVRVHDAPTPDRALFPNEPGSAGFLNWDFGNNSYSGPPPALPLTSGQNTAVRIRLASEPFMGGTLQLSASGPANVPSSVSLSPGEDRMLNVPVTVGTVTSPQQVTVTVTGYGVSRSASATVYPDGIVVTSVNPESGVSSSSSVVGGDAARLDVELSQAAPSGGYTVPVVASDPSAVAISPLTIPAGQSAGLLIVGTQPTDTQKTVTLTIGEISPQTFTITIQPSGG